MMRRIGEYRRGDGGLITHNACHAAQTCLSQKYDMPESVADIRAPVLALIHPNLSTSSDKVLL